ncbi:hypothetical protein CSW59_02200 [Caulobacter sp. BP25]|nr:hypothetical protein CSW59_02200 [Caulobacter sp. BP25]
MHGARFLLGLFVSASMLDAKGALGPWILNLPRSAGLSGFAGVLLLYSRDQLGGRDRLSGAFPVAHRSLKPVPTRQRGAFKALDTRSGWLAQKAYRSIGFALEQIVQLGRDFVGCRDSSALDDQRIDDIRVGGRRGVLGSQECCEGEEQNHDILPRSSDRERRLGFLQSGILKAAITILKL